jgi:hypothetical protein
MPTGFDGASGWFLFAARKHRAAAPEQQSEGAETSLRMDVGPPSLPCRWRPRLSRFCVLSRFDVAIKFPPLERT